MWLLSLFSSRRSGLEAQPQYLDELPDEPVKMSGRTKLAAIVGTTAVAGLIAVVGQFEGKRNDPYLDAVKIATVCFGETRVEMRHYSDAECEEMFAEGLADFAEPVLKRNPELKGRDAQLIAAISLAYNIGIGPKVSRCPEYRAKRLNGGYNCSTVARQFSAGNWKQACDAFLQWKNAGGRPILLKRRQKERAICLRGL